MKSDLSSMLVKGFTRGFQNLGGVGKVFIFVLLGVLLAPIVLRIISFFRRGGEGV